MQDTALFHAFVYLVAALVAVPLTKRLGFGSVLGYLAAGAIIGPHLLGLVGEEGKTVNHFAEFGVVMMLFLVGLELEPARLWRLRGPIFGLGGLQVAVTAVAVALLALAFGTDVRPGLALGLVVAMSSTAMVLQTLQEKGLDRTDGGRASFAVLLFQDISVIPILAGIPLLATLAPTGGGDGGGHGVATLPAWQQALAILAAVVGVVGVGRYLGTPLFRYVASTHLREVFTALALLLVVGISLLMKAVGLSPALGTFLAGVVLANSEYRHALVSDIEPFKGLLLGLFFLTVGAGIDFPLVLGRPLTVLGLVAGVFVLKALVLVVLGQVFKLRLSDRVLLGVALCQVGEFAFVLLGFSVVEGVLDASTASLWSGVVALTMALSPLVFLAAERLLLPRLDRARAVERPADAVPDHARVILAGCGRMGSMILRILRANGIPTTVLELDPDVVDLVRRVGLEAYFGDASRPELLEAAGAAHAQLLILAIDDPARSLEIAEEARRRYPSLQILVRAPGHPDAYAFLNHGFDNVFRETTGSAVEMAGAALRLLGVRGHQVHRSLQVFRRHNERAMRELAAHWGDRKVYFVELRSRIEQGEEELRQSGLLAGLVDPGWDNTSLREEAVADEET